MNTLSKEKNKASQDEKKKDYKYYELTPVEEHGGVWFKRDDLYSPFSDFGITGGKVRQCLYLVESNLDHIRRDCDSTIATAASVFSPQATIVARVAKEFNLHCIIGVGTDEPLKHRAMEMCHELGAEFVTLVTHNAYNNVLYGKLKELNKDRKFFTINFGYQAQTQRTAIITMNAMQTGNLPSDLDAMVINVGSGVSASGILHGLNTPWFDYLFREGKVHLIQPFGYDRRDVIGPAADLDFGQDFHYHKGNYPYHKALNLTIGDVRLDDIYEAKAYDYMVKNLNLKGKICYWLIGNSNILRE